MHEERHRAIDEVVADDDRDGASGDGNERAIQKQPKKSLAVEPSLAS